MFSVLHPHLRLPAYIPFDPPANPSNGGGLHRFQPPPLPFSATTSGVVSRAKTCESVRPGPSFFFSFFFFFSFLPDFSSIFSVSPIFLVSPSYFSGFPVPIFPFSLYWFPSPFVLIGPHFSQSLGCCSGLACPCLPACLPACLRLPACLPACLPARVHRRRGCCCRLGRGVPREGIGLLDIFGTASVKA